MEIIKPIGKMYGKEAGMENLESLLKAWELSIIFKQIQEYFCDRKGISILDFGAGASPFGAFLNRIGYKFITCLDLINGWHPKINQETYNEKYGTRVKYIKTDIIEDYDVIFSASVLEHIKNRNQFKIIQILSEHLKSGGLFIHVADYGRGINFKKVIDNCNIPISYKPEETPGCKEFKNPPEYAWMAWSKKRKNWTSRVAFFNERTNI